MDRDSALLFTDRPIIRVCGEWNDNTDDPQGHVDKVDSHIGYVLSTARS